MASLIEGPSEIVWPGDAAPSLNEFRVHTLPVECRVHVFCHLAYVCIGSILLSLDNSPSHWGLFCLMPVPLIGTILLYTEEGQSTVPALPCILEPVLHC